MPTDDINDLVRGLLRSISPEAIADFGAFYEGFRPLRVTPVGQSRFKQSREVIDRDLGREPIN